MYKLLVQATETCTERFINGTDLGPGYCRQGILCNQRREERIAILNWRNSKNLPNGSCSPGCYIIDDFASIPCFSELPFLLFYRECFAKG